MRRSNDAAVDGGNLAYLAARRLDTSSAEFGVHAFGPDAAALAETMAKQARVGTACIARTWSMHHGLPSTHSG